MYLRIKYQIVIGGCVAYYTNHNVYAITMKLVSSRILFTTSSANGLMAMMDDIGNSYLNAEMNENIYTHAGPKFELVVIMDSGTLLGVIKALYRLSTYGNRCHTHLYNTLKVMGLSRPILILVSILRGVMVVMTILVHILMMS